MDRIADIANEAIEVYNFLGTVDEGNATLDYYTDLNIKGVNESNIDEINILLQNRPYMVGTADDDFVLVEEIQVYINNALNSG